MILRPQQQNQGDTMARPILISGSLLIFSFAVHAADCIPTPHRTTGTHYKPVSVQKTDISSGVIVRGQVLAAPDCAAVAQARVAHWQAGEDGHYSDRQRAYLFTDSKGRFQFETEWPNLNPPHIHFIVTAGRHHPATHGRHRMGRGAQAQPAHQS